MNRKRALKVNVKSVDPDESLRAGEGWVDMMVRWVITEQTMGSEFGVLGHTVFPPGAQHAPHMHENAEEYEFIIKGHGICSSGEHKFEVGPGDAVFVPRGEVHFAKNTDDTEPMEMVWVYAGAPSLEKSGYKKVA